MASPTGFSPDAASYVGIFMIEQPPDWWLPNGYSLTPTGAAAVMATDPTGRQLPVYPIPGYKPTPPRVDSIADVIEQELGQPQIGFTPKTRAMLGMDPNATLPERIAYDWWGPVEAVVALFDLANYGIDATIVGGTEAMSRAGWMNESSAGQLRRDLMLLSIVIAAEAGRSPGRIAVSADAAQLRVASLARAAARVLPPVVIRTEQATGLPFGRVFRVLNVLRADTPVPGATEARRFDSWLIKVRAGKKWELEQADRYDVTQLYIMKDTGKGYRILDALNPKNPTFGAGPVSMKFTQLADIKPESSIAVLREARKNYRPGLKVADVPSTPDALKGTVLQGQLWLEVPVQTKPIPSVVLNEARTLSIKIRDVQGKMY